jgi:hypothetical protein
MNARGSISKALRDAWRKNGPEIRGFVNGAIPSFVTQRSPRDVLDGVPARQRLPDSARDRPDWLPARGAGHSRALRAADR